MVPFLIFRIALVAVSPLAICFGGAASGDEDDGSNSTVTEGDDDGDSSGGGIYICSLNGIPISFAIFYGIRVPIWILILWVMCQYKKMNDRM